MKKIRTIFLFKIKQFFGPIRASKSGFFFGLFAILGINSIGILMGLLPIIEEFSFLFNPNIFDIFLSAFFAIFLAFTLIMSIRGGVSAFQAELDFIFTSPIEPRNYILSDLFFQFAVLHIFFSPFIFFIVGMTLRTILSVVDAFFIIIIYEMFLLFAILVMHSLGMLDLIISNKKPKILISFIIFFLLLPSLSFVNLFPITYSELPYPSTFAAKIISDLFLGNSLEISNIFYLFISFTIILIIHYYISGRNLFQKIRPNIMLSFAEIRPQAQAIRQRSMIEKIGPLTTFLSLNPKKGSVLNYLTKKHLIRMIRDGSFFSISLLFIFYAAFSFISSMLSEMPNTATISPLFILTFYSALVPSILATTWNSSDRENLWLILSSGEYIKDYFKSFFLADLIVAVLFPIGLITISIPFIGLFSLWLILSTLAIASFTSAYSIITLLKMKMPREGGISIGYFLIIFLPIIGGYITSMPFLTMIIFGPTFDLLMQLLIGFILVFYYLFVLYGLLKIIEKKSNSIQM